MRNRFHIIKATFLLVLTVSIYSCGPAVTILNIENRVPAKYPVDFENRSIALFVSIDTSLNLGNHLSQNDSVHMVAVATGIAKELENRLTLDEGAVFIFNHYPGNERLYDMQYIQNLSFISNSDVVVIIDSLRIGAPELINNIASSGGDLYRSNFIHASVFSEIKVYDGTSAKKLTEIKQNDTVYWELLTRSDAREEAMIHRVRNSIGAIAQNVGLELVNKMFPSWIEQQRALFSYSNRDWSRAYSFASQFMWEEAMEIWLKESTDQDKIKVAAAAFNMAVACELTDRLELALEWIGLSYKNYPLLPGVVSYKQFLTEKFETK